MMWMTLETWLKGEKPVNDDDATEQFWHVEDAKAAGKVNERRCIHGKPINVFCGKCES
jgi:hypothetical protein